MDLFTMRCFVSVGNNQSLTKAAREMFITQPAMTTKMNALEAELDTKLLERGRQTHLTSTGEVVYRSFQRIIAEYDSMIDSIEQSEAETHGMVHFGFHGPLDWVDMPAKIAEFHQTNPQIEIDVVIDGWGTLLQKLQAGELDLMIIEQSEIEGLNDIVGVPLFEEPVCVVAHHENPLSSKETVCVDDIRDETMLLPSTDISPRFFHRLYDSFTRAGFKVKRVGQGNHYEATLTLAEAGVGVTCMPQSFCTNAQNVQRVPFRDLDTHMRYQLIWPRGSANAAASAFASYLKDQDWPDGFTS